MIVTSEKIPPEIVYQEMYQERRRYRDYELTASTWYTTILTAILGYVFSSQDNSLLAIGLVKTLVSLLVSIIGFAGIFSVEYVHRRDEEVKNYIKENFKLQHLFKPDDFRFKPYNVIEFTLLCLVLFIIGVLVSNVVFPIIFLIISLIKGKYLLNIVFDNLKLPSL